MIRGWGLTVLLLAPQFFADSSREDKHYTLLSVIVIILAVIGALALFSGLGMGAMHASMMGGGAIGWIIGILLLIGFIVAAIFIFGSRRR